MQRDPNVEKLCQCDPDANRELLSKLLRHSGKCKDCPVVRLLRLHVSESRRRREGDGYEGQW